MGGAFNLSLSRTLGQPKGARRVTRLPLKAEAPDYAPRERKREGNRVCWDARFASFPPYAFLSYFRVDENFAHVPGGKQINHRYVQARFVKIPSNLLLLKFLLIVEKTYREIVN